MSERWRSVWWAYAGLALLPITLGAWSTGPPADRVGLCYARPSCQDAFCHDSFPLNAGTQVSTLALEGGPLPSTYRAGDLMHLLLSVADSNPTRQRFGFQLGAVADCPIAVAGGGVVVLELARTQLVNGGALTFIEHTCNGFTTDVCGYLPTSVGMNEWYFDWQAPSEPIGDITFFWAINAANGDATENGDYVNLFSTTLAPHCPGRLESLKLARVDCDLSTPGVPDIQLSWDPLPFSNGYRMYSTLDVTALANPGTSGANEILTTCVAPPPEELVFFTVVGLCVDASDGP